MQPFECTGQWWLPDKQKESVAGTLKVSASGALRLWLVGSLEQSEIWRSKAHPIILGFVDKNPFGVKVSIRASLAPAFEQLLVALS